MEEMSWADKERASWQVWRDYKAASFSGCQKQSQTEDGQLRASVCIHDVFHGDLHEVGRGAGEVGHTPKKVDEKTFLSRHS